MSGNSAGVLLALFIAGLSLAASLGATGSTVESNTEDIAAHHLRIAKLELTFVEVRKDLEYIRKTLDEIKDDIRGH